MKTVQVCAPVSWTVLVCGCLFPVAEQVVAQGQVKQGVHAGQYRGHRRAGRVQDGGEVAAGGIYLAQGQARVAAVGQVQCVIDLGVHRVVGQGGDPR
jgi:demethoxyubiquinone hydroxylase (CLK1/Coq7/Cat5 family)